MPLKAPAGVALVEITCGRRMAACRCCMWRTRASRIFFRWRRGRADADQSRALAQRSHQRRRWPAALLGQPGAGVADSTTRRLSRWPPSSVSSTWPTRSTTAYKVRLPRARRRPSRTFARLASAGAGPGMRAIQSASQSSRPRGARRRRASTSRRAPASACRCSPATGAAGNGRCARRSARGLCLATRATSTCRPTRTASSWSAATPQALRLQARRPLRRRAGLKQVRRDAAVSGPVRRESGRCPPFAGGVALCMSLAVCPRANKIERRSPRTASADHLWPRRSPRSCSPARRSTRATPRTPWLSTTPLLRAERQRRAAQRTAAALDRYIFQHVQEGRRCGCFGAVPARFP